MIHVYPLRVVIFLVGWTSLLLGGIGIFLPVLPTTPFILLSALCFSRSSPRFHHWLISHPVLGCLIQNWQRHGCIAKSAKIKATIFIIGTFSFTFVVMDVGLSVKGLIGILGVAVMGFIWTRPTHPRETILPGKIVLE